MFHTSSHEAARTERGFLKKIPTHPPFEVLSKNDLALSPRCDVYTSVHTQSALEPLSDVRLLTEVSSVLCLAGCVGSCWF